MSDPVDPLVALIARLEAAPGPDPVLDAEIARLFGWRQDQRCPARWVDPAGELRQLPAFTGSIDVSVGLLPPGCYWIVGTGRLDPAEPLYGCSVHSGVTDLELGGGESDAHAALAICSAAVACLAGSGGRA